MAATKPPYDPVKTVVGMFNGSVTRIAYALKDPSNFAPSTKAVLAETAKKFQDALDDCEIQVSEAKWYLERKLALNKARREAKAREDSVASAKRKREEEKDAQDRVRETEKENASKRVKTAEPDEPTSTQPTSQQAPPADEADEAASQSTAKAAEGTEGPATDKPKVAVATDTKTKGPVKADEQSTALAPVPGSTLTQTTADEFPKITPQDTPAAGNEDFNFVSMFGDVGGDATDGGAPNDLNFDLSLGEAFDADAVALNVQDASLNSLLPGVESYASQAADGNAFNLGGTGDLGAVAAGPNNGQQVGVNDFSLPALGHNEFDDLLNANDMNFDGSLGLNDDGLMDMENMHMEFDSMFK